MKESILVITFGIALSFTNLAFADAPSIGYADSLSQIALSIDVTDLDNAPAIVPKNESFNIDMSSLATVKAGATWSRVNDNKIAGIFVAFSAFKAVYKPYSMPSKIPPIPA